VRSKFRATVNSTQLIPYLQSRRVASILVAISASSKVTGHSSSKQVGSSWHWDILQSLINVMCADDSISFDFLFGNATVSTRQ